MVIQTIKAFYDLLKSNKIFQLVLFNTDEAMYIVKRSGKNKYAIV